MHGGMCLRCAFGWKLHETWQVLFSVHGEFWKNFVDLDVFTNSAKLKIKSPNHVRFQMRQKEKTQNYGFVLINF